MNIIIEQLKAARQAMGNADDIAVARRMSLVNWGSPNGPTFPQLLARYRAQGLEGDALLERIIAGAQTGTRLVDATFGVTFQHC